MGDLSGIFEWKLLLFNFGESSCLRNSVFVFYQELLSLAKRKRGDSEEKEAPVSKPTASSDSETSDSDIEVSLCLTVN